MTATIIDGKAVAESVRSQVKDAVTYLKAEYNVTPGLATVLVKMDPGAGLPDHEHVLIEQTYMIEGRLVDQEGPDEGIEAGPGDFIWRPAGSRHAVKAPEGALMIAVFQIPNKFFEKDGSIVDQLGHDWGENWSAALARHKEPA